MVLALAAVSCTVNKRTPALVCEGPADCDPDRTCVDGFCVLAGEVDASTGDGPVAIDAAGADAIATACTDWTYSPVHVDPCAIEAPSPGLDLDAEGQYVYDTDDGTLTDPGGGDVPNASSTLDGLRVASIVSFSLGPDASLRVIGAAPLVIVSWTTASIEGDLDATSNLTPAAGSNPAACPTLNAPQNDNGGGGGGGGGFGSAGGVGGTGGSDSGAGGLAGPAVVTPTTLLGGCPGGTGGEGNQGPGAGPGGDGGGAVFVTAFSSVEVTGTVHAGGAGGQGSDGANNRNGGGGGGSGGYLGFEAPTVTLDNGAIVAANGGGGGGGTNGQVGDPGEAGKVGLSPAAGGDGEQGGNGGDGATGIAPGSPGSPGNRGGGGGGGGVGFVFVYSTTADTANAIISGIATTLPLN